MRELTFFSKAGLFRRAHRVPTLNESCASITSSADCAIGTSLGSSIVSRFVISSSSRLRLTSRDLPSGMVTVAYQVHQNYLYISLMKLDLLICHRQRYSIRFS